MAEIADVCDVIDVSCVRCIFYAISQNGLLLSCEFVVVTVRGEFKKNGLRFVYNVSEKFCNDQSK